ncbi:hypothetical protein [Shewanella mangrovisoli]|uniref:hypothetical protein n=1 Tax=Shewanella mangrovisoli TaxID=2864211 RepID=UPI0035BA40F7
MSLPVTVYRWDDAGAPSLTGRTQADFIAIIKACLATGYGTKAAAGWTVAFEDAGTTQLVLRNDTVNGSGGFLHLYASGANAAGGTLLMVSAKNMTALGAYTDRGWISAIKSQSTQHTQWVIFATSKGFYFYLKTSANTTAVGSGSYEYFFFAGDFQSTLINDAGNFVIVKQLQNSDDITASSSVETIQSIAPNNSVCKIYDADGGNGSLTYYASKGLLYDLSTTVDGSAEDKGLQHYLQPWSLVTTSQFTPDRVGTPAVNSTKSPSLRGFLPGLMNSSFSGYGNKPWPAIETFNNAQHLGIGNGYNIQLWLNMETWYD